MRSLIIAGLLIVVTAKVSFAGPKKSFTHKLTTQEFIDSKAAYTQSPTLRAQRIGTWCKNKYGKTAVYLAPDSCLIPGDDKGDGRGDRRKK